MEKINNILSNETLISSPNIVKPAVRIIGFIGRVFKLEHKHIKTEIRAESRDCLCNLLFNYADNLKILSVIQTSLKCLCELEDYVKLSKNYILSSTYFALCKTKDTNILRTSLYLTSKLSYQDISSLDKYPKLLVLLYEILNNSEDPQLVENTCKTLSKFSENIELRQSLKDSLKQSIRNGAASPLRGVSNRFPGNSKIKKYCVQTLHNLEGNGCIII